MNGPVLSLTRIILDVVESVAGRALLVERERSAVAARGRWRRGGAVWRGCGAYEAPDADSFADRALAWSPGAEGEAATGRYPARAPRARAIWRHASRSGVARGRCTRRRRTERTTWAPSLSNRSRSQVTWRAQAVRAASQPHLLHEHVGGGRQQDPQLVRPEAVTARAVDLQAVVQFLDAVLDVAAPAVDLLVEEARRLAQVGDDEARVVARLPAGELHDFGLDHHAALTRSRAGAIAGVEVEVRRLLSQPVLGAGRHHDVLGSPQQHGVLGHRHDVVEPRLGIEEIEDLRAGEGRRPGGHGRRSQSGSCRGRDRPPSQIHRKVNCEVRRAVEDRHNSSRAAATGRPSWPQRGGAGGSGCSAATATARARSDSVRMSRLLGVGSQRGGGHGMKRHKARLPELGASNLQARKVADEIDVIDLEADRLAGAEPTARQLPNHGGDGVRTQRAARTE